MKKRIGSKLYNTETSEYIADVGGGDLYRKRTREREWFLVMGGDHIEPVDDAQARALLGESSYREKPRESKRINISVDLQTHAKIARMAKRDKMGIAEEIKWMVERLE